jgi:hypothetical protein
LRVSHRPAADPPWMKKADFRDELWRESVPFSC